MKFNFSSLYRRTLDTTTEVIPATHPHNPLPASELSDAAAPLQSIGAVEPVTVFPAQTQLALHDPIACADHAPSSFAIPRAAIHAERLSERWLTPGVAVNIAGTVLEGGMLYVGARPRNGERRDPSSIDPGLEVGYAGDYSAPITGYYPSYATITASQRRAYLNWLAGGRRDPSVAIGFVFLYFYGLERRVLADGTSDVEVRAEFPGIEREVKRLIAIYGSASRSFSGYATRLLALIAAIAPQQATCFTEHRPPIFQSAKGYLTWALARCAADDAPLPAKLALLYLSARKRPKALADHEAIYTPLFLSAYEDAFPEGLMLTQSQREISITYHAASHGLGGGRPAEWRIAGLYHCGNEESMFEWIMDVSQQATAQITAYAKAARTSKEPWKTGAESLHALLLLPRRVWPTTYGRRFQALAAATAPAFPLITLEELRRLLRIDHDLSRAQIDTLEQVLEEHRLGVEPSFASRTKTPRDDDSFCLFVSDDQPLKEGPIDRTTYPAARLAMHLAYCVASQGSDVAGALALMDASASVWPELHQHSRARLRAFLRVVHTEPKATSKLSIRVRAVDPSARSALAPRIAAMAIGASTPTPEQVKTLGQIYAALGANPDEAILDIHRLGAIDPSSATVAAVPAVAAIAATVVDAARGFRLDAARVASLQRDTAKTSALLADIFVSDDEEQPSCAGSPDQPPPPEKLAVECPQKAPAADHSPIPGLNSAQATFALLLLTRSEWSREELLAAASRHDLMLDGALEAINDAAFDHLDIPFSEGDDPVMLNSELVERLAK